MLIQSSPDAATPPTWRRRLTHRAALRWYPGAGLSLLYQVPVVAQLWRGPGSFPAHVITTVLLAAVCAAFALLPPILWWEDDTTRLAAVVVYFAVTLILLPFLGVTACWTWVYVAGVAGMVITRPLVGVAAIMVLGVTQLLVFAATGTLDDNWVIILVTVSVGLMLTAFARQLDALRRLREAQGEIARLAVVEERARFSRDMHDVLGHSLTVVTVKSELARRLVGSHPDKAVEELADIERLSRSALADLRAAVAGYREMSLSTELAAAQASLAAAEIRAHLPRNGEDVEPELRELFGWVLREGVTNVIRHSGARNCWVSVTPCMMRIEDDGHGPAPIGTTARNGGTTAEGRASGSGLAGLGVRATAVDAELVVETRTGGGTTLIVRRTA